MYRCKHFVLLLVFMSSANLALCQSFVEAPRDVTVREGETAQFRCIIRNLSPQQNVYWFRLSTRKFLTTNITLQNTEQRNRISLRGNTNLGEFFLRIRDTVLSDAGSYRCGYAIPNMPFTFRSADLIVLRPPNQGFPRCEVSPQNPEIGDIAALTCRSEGGHPPALLAWSTGLERLTDMKETMNTLAVVISEEHNGKEFLCTATSTALNNPRTCSVILLNIPPEVRVEPPQNIAEVGRRAVFTCVAFGLPAITRYEWRFMNAPVDVIPRIEISADGRTLMINDVRQEDDGASVHCTATTTNGLSATAGALLRVVEAMETTTALTTGIETTTFNNTMEYDGVTGKPSTVVIVIIVIAVLVGQVLFILLVYVLHRATNRMMKERKARRGPTPVRKPTEMQENVYVRDKTMPSAPPGIDPETGTPAITKEGTYSDVPSMGEAIYNGPQYAPSLTQSMGSAIYSLPPDDSHVVTITAVQASAPEYSNLTELEQASVPEYSNLTELEQATSGSLSTTPAPHSPSATSESFYAYSEVPFVEEIDEPRRPQSLNPTSSPRPVTITSSPPTTSPPPRPVNITSPPPNKIPPRLPADKRQPRSPHTNQYQGLSPDRPFSQYLSLRHYDDVYADEVLKEGERLDGEYNDDGYVYELPPTETCPDDVYDIPPDASKREYTFMGGRMPPEDMCKV